MNVLQVREDLVLRPLVTEDTAELFKLVEKNRIYLRAWLPWVDKMLTLEDEENYILQSAADAMEGGKMEIGIFSQRHQGEKKWKLIGMCGIVNNNRVNKEESFAELGYWLDQDQTGKGIITSACKVVLEYAFTSLRLSKVKIMAHCENVRSTAVAQRLNFILTEEKITKPHPKFHSDISKVYIYKLDRKDWERNLEKE